MKLNRENLIKCLEQIDYKLVGRNPNEFIANHKKECTYIRVWENHLEAEVGQRGDDGEEIAKYKIYAYFEKCDIEVLEGGNCCHIGDTGDDAGVFIHLYNFDIESGEKN